jgi:hypothetical protein
MHNTAALKKDTHDLGKAMAEYFSKLPLFNDHKVAAAKAKYDPEMGVVVIQGTRYAGTSSIDEVRHLISELKLPASACTQGPDLAYLAGDERPVDGIQYFIIPGQALRQLIKFETNRILALPEVAGLKDFLPLRTTKDIAAAAEGYAKKRITGSVANVGVPDRY